LRHPLDPLFNPAGVAVIGASTVLHKTGGRRWRSMVQSGFAGPLYPIHPTASEILGRKAYRSLREAPGPVEMAVVLVRPDLVPSAVADCVAVGVRSIVVITAGFGETAPKASASSRSWWPPRAPAAPGWSARTARDSSAARVASTRWAGMSPAGRSR